MGWALEVMAPEVLAKPVLQLQSQCRNGCGRVAISTGEELALTLTSPGFPGLPDVPPTSILTPGD